MKLQSFLEDSNSKRIEIFKCKKYKIKLIYKWIISENNIHNPSYYCISETLK